MPIFTFMRTEIKYVINRKQHKLLVDFLKDHMVEDKHGKVTIQSLYFDTDKYLLIRRSIEKPKYKEKLRLRSYGLLKEGKTGFLEIKKKMDHVVYKRRISLTEEECKKWIATKHSENDTQIGREIAYLIDFYRDLKPKMLIIYDRDAYVDPNSDLRITFDTNARYRTEDLSLNSSLEGTKLVDDDVVIMEVKSSMALPMWLVRKLSQEKIRLENIKRLLIVKILVLNRSLIWIFVKNCIQEIYTFLLMRI